VLGAASASVSVSKSAAYARAHAGPLRPPCRSTASLEQWSLSHPLESLLAFGHRLVEIDRHELVTRNPMKNPGMRPWDVREIA
jgi:hypothetical protein